MIISILYPNFATRILLINIFHRQNVKSKSWLFLQQSIGPDSTNQYILQLNCSTLCSASNLKTNKNISSFSSLKVFLVAVYPSQLLTFVYSEMLHSQHSLHWTCCNNTPLYLHKNVISSNIKPLFSRGGLQNKKIFKK